MFKRLLFAGLAVAAIAPVAAQANGVSVAVSTPQFGIRIGAPVFGPPVIPVYAPVPVYAPAPIYAPAPVYAPAPLYAPPPVVYVPRFVAPRVYVPAPVMVAPRVVYPRNYYRPPVVVPYDQNRYHHYGPDNSYNRYSQQAAFVPPGHAKRYSGGRYQ
jgi:hypothetical protein